MLPSCPKMSDENFNRKTFESKLPLGKANDEKRNELYYTRLQPSDGLFINKEQQGWLYLVPAVTMKCRNIMRIMHINKKQLWPWEMMTLQMAMTLVTFGLDSGRDLGYFFVHRQKHQS